MPLFNAACVQLRSGKTLSDNTAAAENLIRAAAGEGAQYIQTPEMSNVLVRSRGELMERISEPEGDPFLAMARSVAGELGYEINCRYGDHITLRRLLLEVIGGPQTAVAGADDHHVRLQILMQCRARRQRVVQLLHPQTHTCKARHRLLHWLIADRD